VSAQRDGNQVIIRVEDRGPGIAARDARHIFEPFYRGRHSTRVRGSGLGLAIVKRVAVAHGGTVRLEKRTGGASFVLALPEVQHA
jgi:signal transduction histidine kinase